MSDRQAPPAPLIRNFRGARALVVHPAGETTDRLQTVLKRLGLTTRTYDPETLGLPLEPGTCDEVDVIFFDADQGDGPFLPSDETVSVPAIAMIGVEAPSRLIRAVSLESCSYLLKPLRSSSGVFTALFMAFNEHNRRQAEQARQAAQQARLSARRYVIKAVLMVMEARTVDDEEAFRLIRKESMRKRLSVEDFCQRLVAGQVETSGNSDCSSEVL